MDGLSAIIFLIVGILLGVAGIAWLEEDRVVEASIFAIASGFCLFVFFNAVGLL